MNHEADDSRQDPLGLTALPQLEPTQDGWLEVRRALEADARSRRRLKRAGGWLAAAATLVLAVGVVNQRQGDEPDAVPELAHEPAATPESVAASTGHEDTVHELIAMSQMLERRLRGLREESTVMPAQSAVYVAELEDMIARVDGDLSLNPESVDLWGQRVNLLLDLELIFQHHWEREYGRMAAR